MANTMIKLWHVCCCCGCTNSGRNTRYTQGLPDFDNDGDPEDDGESKWNMHLIMSSDDEDEEGSADEWTLDSITVDENSVEDDEYYRVYRPEAHHPLDPEQQQQRARTTKSTHMAMRCVTTARRLSIEHADAMTRPLHTRIVQQYRDALDCCPTKYRARVVREYESFNQTYFAVMDQEDYQKAESIAKQYWQGAKTLNLTEKQRIDFYRLALMCMPVLHINKSWKKEYNIMRRIAKHNESSRRGIGPSIASEPARY